MNKITNRLYISLTTLLFLFFIFFQVRYHFFTIDHISWLSADDGDITYQVDRLLINANTPNYSQTSSIEIDYGSELNLLAPVLKVINSFGKINFLNSYYLITFTHLLLGMAGLLLITTFFGKNYLEKTLWVAVALLSPLFGYHMGFIKPDANIVFFFIVLSLYFCAKKNLTLAHLVWALFFAAFGFAIKWWSLFCLPGITYSLYQLNENNPKDLNKYAKLALWGAILSMIPTTWYLTDEAISALLKNHIHNILTITPSLVIKSGLFAITSAFFVLAYFLFKFFIKSANKIIHFGGIVLFQIIIFTSSYIFCSIPFTSSGFFLRSLYSNAVGDFQITKIGTDQRKSILDVVLFWVSEFKDYHYFSPVLLIVLFFVIGLLFVKKQKFDHFIKILFCFLGSYFLFIFMLLNRNNRAMISMLYPLFMIFPFYLGTFFPHSYKKTMILLLVAFSQIFYQSNGKWGSLKTIYLERDDLKTRVDNSAQWLEKNFSHIKTFQMCDYAMPQSTNSPFTFNYHWRYFCNDNLQQIFEQQIDNHAWVIPRDKFHQFISSNPEILKTKKITEYSTFFIRNPVHYSIIENK